MRYRSKVEVMEESLESYPLETLLNNCEMFQRNLKRRQSQRGATPPNGAGFASVSIAIAMLCYLLLLFS